MALFLLIHGSQHGAWCWEKVRHALRERGHRALAIDLPGHGAALTPRRGITLEHYRRAVTDFVEREDLRDLVLVGHSLAGVFMSAAAADLKDRLHKLVFLAAMVLEAGEAPLDFAPPERRARYRQLAEASPDFSFKAPYRLAREFYLEELSETEARACYEKLTPQPFGVWLEKFVDQGFAGLAVPREFVICARDRVFAAEVYERFAARAGAAPLRIDAGHDVMLSHPAALAELLDRLGS